MTLQGGNRKVLIVGNYRFTGRLLGKGNFARVEEAVHNILNVKVAVKIMDLNLIKEDYVIRNLCREARLMAKLNHPCIVALYQTMQRSDNVYYLVTELASGGDLCTFIKNQRNGRLEERASRIYARQFVSALAHMHNIGVVHRDLKMENVMLNSAQTQIKVVDFGLSNFYTPDDPLRTHCGSPEYAAPELFITGRKYGPEVDLWSLGIILYGMVVGQLPFISNRTEQISSQERRKKLVAQINKGLSPSHKRALAVFSVEFRNVINRMLVAEKSKRISIKELLMHPWITERGTRLIRSNPLKKLEPRHQASIMADICELTHQSSQEVVATLKQEPFSKLGGMYNMLAHRLALCRMSGDGITRAPPTIETDFSPSREKNAIKRPYNLRNLATRSTPKQSEETITPNRGNTYTPRVLVQERKTSYAENRPSVPPLMRPKTEGRRPSIESKRPSTESKRPSTECRRPSAESKRPSTPVPTFRPRTVQSQSTEKRVNYRDIKTPFMARKAYSAGITPKTTRPVTVSSPIATNVSKSVDRRNAIDVAKRLCPTSSSEDRSDKKGVIEEHLKFSSLTNRLKIKVKPEKSEPKRAQTAVDRKQRSKSEKLAVPAPVRPMTTVGTAVSGVRKALGLGTTQSEPKAANKPLREIGRIARYTKKLTVISIDGMSPSADGFELFCFRQYRPFTRFLKGTRQVQSAQPIEKSNLAFGDSPNKNVQAKLKKPTIYDPIARSIAGYVCNNVPDKLPNLSHFKK